MYNLKTNPRKIVGIPENYALIAEKTVRLAKDNLNMLLDEPYPFLKEIGFQIDIHALSSMKKKRLDTLKRQYESYSQFQQAQDKLHSESLKIQDRLYLRVCIYENEQSKDKTNRQYKASLDSMLIDVIQRL